MSGQDPRPPYDPDAEGGAYDASAPQGYGQGGTYGHDAGQAYPPQPTYDAGRPYDPQQPYGPGPAQESLQPFDPQYGQHTHPAGEAPEGSGHPQGWTYVPEPMAGQLPPEAESGAAFGVPSSGDSWNGGAAGYADGGAAADGWGGTAAPGRPGQPWQGAPDAGPAAGAHGDGGQGGYGHGGAAPADGHGWDPAAGGGQWTDGGAAAPGYGGGGRSGPGGYETQDGYGHAGPGAGFVNGGGAAPADGHGWDQTAGAAGGGHWAGADASAQPGRAWQGGPAAGGYGRHDQNGRDANGQNGAQPHGYADPQTQPYGQQAAGIEHTAVLPVFSEQEAGPYAAAQGGGPGVTLPRQHGPNGPQAAQGAPGPVRTGSPIIPPGIQPAAITVALALLTAGGAALGRPALAVVLLALEGLTAAGWFRLNGMWPARQGIMLAFLGGVTADIGLLAADGGHATEVLLGTLGVWLLLVLVLQLRHHGSADERLSSLTATSVSTLLTVVAASYLATAVSGSGSDPVVVGAVAVAAATLVRAVRLPGGEPVSVALALIAAAATAAATGPMTGFGTGHALLLALACGAAALIGLRVASYDFPSRFVHFTAGVALPLTAAAPVVYALGAALT